MMLQHFPLVHSCLIQVIGLLDVFTPATRLESIQDL